MAGAFDSTTAISVRGNWNKTNYLGIVPVTVSRATEIAAIPQRGGVHDPKDPDSWIHQPPTYEVDGVLKRKAWCGRCGAWQRQEAFYPDKTHTTGRRRICRTCERIQNHENYLKRKVLTTKAA